MPFVGGVLVTSVVGCFVYLKVASRYGPYAIPNFRSLHRSVIPRGGGLAVAVATLSGILAWHFHQSLSLPEKMIFLVGGGVFALVGFADDRLDISAGYRLAIQLAGAIWLCLWAGGLPSLDVGFARLELGWVGGFLVIIPLLWFYNLYNFIDGIDGMAASATTFIGFTMGTIMFVEHQFLLALILAMLATANLGFLFFNWPPAKMFLGESGTSFISYTLSAVILISLSKSVVSIWIWLIVFACYLSDTTTTTMIRAFRFGRDFYLPHRSHAYQNLARIWNSHLRVVLIVLGIDLFWLVPFLWLAREYQTYAILAAVVAYSPLVLLALKFGPFFEDK